MTEKIIAGTDGSAEATKAAAWAAGLARRLGAELLVVHVFDVDPAKLPGGYVVLPAEDVDRLRDQSQRMLDTAWSEPAREGGGSWHTVLVDGNAAAALMNLAEREHASLIVIGSRGRGGFADLLFGSTGHHLVQHARVPVTVVPSR